MKTSKVGSARYERLMPAGIPKWIRCYDYGDESIDRYTVVFSKKAITFGELPGRSFLYLSMNAYPFHSQGFGQHGESENTPIDWPTYGHLGKKIKFKDLPEDCQKCVIYDYKELWDLE